ncbi:MAG TPA: type II toxin-antitoxin system HicA family toxin, partial [Pyrinomonadaceae bacterium]|nr:type II toxin-antitoxin system HicA family toxin [Pyrinomonadaceae bacterium]
PALSGTEVVRVLESFGWNVARQRGSHIIMTKAGEIVTLSIPNQRGCERYAEEFDSLGQSDS